MARKLRFQYPGAIYHVTARGNKRGDIYLCDDDRRIFLSLLTEAAERFGWLCAAYCLMDNHYHLLIKTIQATLSKGMHWLNGGYTQRFNKRHGQVGHLFQGRFGDSLVQDGAYLQAVSRYVVLNPVKDHLVSSPEEWAWSSYRATLGMEQPLGCLDTRLVLDNFGETYEVARNEYVRFVAAGIGLDEERAMELPIIGDDEFIRKHQKAVGVRVHDREYSIAQRFLDRPTLEDLFRSCCSLSNKEKQIRNNKIYLAAERYCYSQKEIADFLSLHYSGISNIIKAEKLKIKDATPWINDKKRTDR